MKNFPNINLNIQHFFQTQNPVKKFWEIKHIKNLLKFLIPYWKIFTRNLIYLIFCFLFLFGISIKFFHFHNRLFIKQAFFHSEKHPWETLKRRSYCKSLVWMFICVYITFLRGKQGCDEAVLYKWFSSFNKNSGLSFD